MWSRVRVAGVIPWRHGAITSGEGGVDLGRHVNRPPLSELLTRGEVDRCPALGGIPNLEAEQDCPVPERA